MKLLFITILIGTLLLPVILDQGYAQEETPAKSLTLEVTNTKTGAVSTRVWDLSTYSFEQVVSVDVPEFRVSKIKQVFGTDTFSFALQNKVLEADWLHFEVKLSGTPTVGKGLKVQFT